MNKKLDILVEQTETYSASLAKELTSAKAHAMAAQGQEFAPVEDGSDPTVTAIELKEKEQFAKAAKTGDIEMDVDENAIGESKSLDDDFEEEEGDEDDDLSTLEKDEAEIAKTELKGNRRKDLVAEEQKVSVLGPLSP